MIPGDYSVLYDKEKVDKACETLRSVAVQSEQQPNGKG